MIRCKRCLLPNTAPNVLFDHDLCMACINYDKRALIDWDERHSILKNICSQNTKTNYYDCVVPVSGGKDSHYIVYVIKEKMGMNPLLVTVGDPFTKTKAGTHNYNNLSEMFNCDQVVYNISRNLFRRVTRSAFEKLGEPLKFVELVIYMMPFKIAAMMNIPLVVFGENSAYEYGYVCVDNYSANKNIDNMFSSCDYNFWIENGVTMEEMNSIAPLKSGIKMPEVVYMSHFYPWSSTNNLNVARRYGFVDLSNEWKRLGYIDDFEQIDSMAYLIHLWMKYPKFGFQRTTDIVSRRIREGLLTKEQGLDIINRYDHEVDPLALNDFISFLGYTYSEFWDVVENWWNKDIFVKIDGIWRMK